MLLNLFKFALISILISAVRADGHNQCGVRKYENSSVWPWHAILIRRSTGEFFCASTIISKRHVLTAAHCLKHSSSSSIKPSKSFEILFGGYNSSDTRNRNWTRRNATKITIHPDWKVKEKRFDADLAIIELDSPITFSDNVGRACMPASDRKVSNINGTVIGYDYKNRILGQTLRRLDIPTTDLTSCVLQDEQFAQVISQRMFCGGVEGTTACSGDGGSGFYERDANGRWTILGIVSTGLVDFRIDECDLSKYAAFTNVPMFIDWIKMNVRVN